jgi:hypothetical protein
MREEVIVPPLSKRIWVLLLSSLFLIVCLSVPFFERESAQIKYTRVKTYSTLNEVSTDLGNPSYITNVHNRNDLAGWRYGEQAIVVEYSPADQHIVEITFFQGLRTSWPERIRRWLRQ